MVDNFDGSGRTPRPQQAEALKWLAENWANSDVFAIQAPPGTGKQAIAMTLQRAYKAAYITTENILVKQALDTYPEANFLIGRQHYMCKHHEGLSCQDISLYGTVCKNCTYQKARKRALALESTIYNPISYYYISQHPKWVIPTTLVVDEAHRLIDTMMLLTGEEFGKAYQPPACTAMVNIIEWMEAKEFLLLSLMKKEPFEKAVQLNLKYQKLKRVREALIKEPEKFIIHWTNDKLNIRPIYPTADLKKQMLACSKLVLMSATLYKSDVRQLTDKPFMWLELDSPIPEHNRPVVFDPVPTKVTYLTDPRIVAAWIVRTLNKYPNRNTIIHASYSWCEKIKPLLPFKVFTNTKDNKTKVLKRFIEKGGIWLAAGCAEGLDLKGDICTLNLIPMLPRANIEDAIIKKRLSLAGGQTEYDLNVLRTIQQQAGRSTRSEDDKSIIVIGDPSFKTLVYKHKKDIPTSFYNSIVWRQHERIP